MGVVGVPGGRLLTDEFMGAVFWLLLWGAGIVGAFFAGTMIAYVIAETVLGEEALFNDTLKGTIVYAGGALGIGLLLYFFW